MPAGLYSPGVQHADVIVVGLGAMGSAAAYQLARRGANVIGIDRFSPPHTSGSTHGDTRITRQAIGEGQVYVPLVLRSHEIWREIEHETGADLLNACGGLILTAHTVTGGNHGVVDFFASTVAAADVYGIDHEVLSTDEVIERFPQFRLNEDHRCYYEPGAGFVRPEAAVMSQLDLAQRHGACIQRDERVVRIDSTGTGVVVETGTEEYFADQAIITVGPWMGQVAGNEDLARLCRVYRQVLHWFDTSTSKAQLTPDQMPVFIWEFGAGEEDSFYGFPAVDGPNGGLKVATEQYGNETDPDDLDRAVRPGEAEAMFRDCVDGRLPLTGSAVKSVSCLYTVTPDYGFIIDRHPDHANILVASPCSGHGFKHSAAIGESLAQWAIDGESMIDLSSFASSRFQK